MANPDDLARLAAAFRTTEYAVEIEGQRIPLRVGSSAERLEQRFDAKRHGFITAWNPGSTPSSSLENKAADGALVVRLEALGVPHLRASARAENGDHYEAGWLVGDLDFGMLDVLAREFGQDGTLGWTRGQAVRLRMYHPQPAGKHDDIWTDWLG